MKNLDIFPILVFCSLTIVNTHSQSIGLHVEEGAVLFGPDTKGGGAKLMWLPDNSAFRAGRISGMQWDPANIGFNSTALGYNTLAKGNYSTAMGYQTQATGFNAVAIGTNTLASGTWSLAMGNSTRANSPSSTAMGFSTMANGTSSTAMGVSTMANGTSSTAMGVSTIANGFGSTVVGIYNDTVSGPQTAINRWTPLFVVGNGDDPNNRSNALIVYKDGGVNARNYLEVGTESGHFHIGGNVFQQTRGDSLIFLNPYGGNIIIFDEEIGDDVLQVNDHLLVFGGIRAPDLPFGDRANMQYETSTGRFYYDNSSRRYKENIQTLKDDWRKILLTRPVRYTRSHSPDYWEFGYIAEEIDSIGLTNLVDYDQEGLPNDVRYDKMVLYLTEMIKQQEQEMTDMREQIAEMKDVKAEHENMQKRIAALEDQLR